MGVRERRDRDRERTRKAILAAARELFVRDGYQQVSMRKIAGRIEYSAGAIYGYFTSKDDIFFALAEQGFRLFHRALNVRPLPRDPIEALRQRFWRFYQFSKSQPEYFTLMFVDRAVPRISRDWDRIAFTQRMRTAASDLIERAIREGALPGGTDPGAAFHILATAVHGAAVIRLGDRFRLGRAADALARDMLDTAIAGLQSGVRTRFRAAACFQDATTERVPHSRSKESKHAS